eukprot:m.308471 g.308471  ORF g.308471 m.308471 type:complete len:792 (+) comp44058_c0_seq1:38-2413(+)
MAECDCKERVTTLEQKLSEVEKDNLNLRSVISDLFGRVQALEGPTKGSLKGSYGTKSLTYLKTATAPLSSIQKTRTVQAGPTKKTTTVIRTTVIKTKNGKEEVSTKTTKTHDFVDGKAPARALSPSGGGQRVSKRGVKRNGPVTNQPRQINVEDRSIHLRGRSVTSYAPTRFDFSTAGDPNAAAAAPDEKLRLDWVYGYRGRDCRSNLYFLSPSGELVYFIAAVAVLYSPETKKQRHFVEHNDDIKCLAVHPNEKLIATGQVAGHDKGSKPHVLVWDVDTLSVVSTVGLSKMERAVGIVAFSTKNDGAHLLAIDERNDHMLTIWDWKKNRLLCETKTTGDPVLCAAFHPTAAQISLATCGKQHVAFYHLGTDGKIQKKNGLFEKHPKPKFVTSMMFNSKGDLLTGDSNGNIFLWENGSQKITKAIKDAHTGPVFSLSPIEGGEGNNFLSGGGKDGTVIHWDGSNCTPIAKSKVPENYGGIRTAVGIPQGLFAIGTTRNCIAEGSFQGDHFVDLIQGHSDELWGLAAHPKSNVFVSAGQDKLLMMWNASTHTSSWSTTVSDAAQSAGFHPSGAFVAIGLINGRWLVFDSSSGNYVASEQDGNEEISAIQYSPDGSKLAIASHDNHIYIYNVSDDGKAYERHKKCSGHSSYVTHVDWSADSQFLQSSSGDYELLYWEASSGKHIASSNEMRDVDWASYTCPLGFPVSGIWPEGADGTDINSVHRNGKQDLLATGDDFGQVNLFRYPCYQSKSESSVGRGHSSHVSCVRFLGSDVLLLSTGGRDMSIMQWELTA